MTPTPMIVRRSHAIDSSTRNRPLSRTLFDEPEDLRQALSKKKLHGLIKRKEVFENRADARVRDLT
jgi:hypothetical protein